MVIYCALPFRTDSKQVKEAHWASLSSAIDTRITLLLFETGEIEAHVEHRPTRRHIQPHRSRPLRRADSAGALRRGLRVEHAQRSFSFHALPESEDARAARRADVWGQSFYLGQVATKLIDEPTPDE